MDLQQTIHRINDEIMSEYYSPPYAAPSYSSPYQVPRPPSQSNSPKKDKSDDDDVHPILKKILTIGSIAGGAYAYHKMQQPKQPTIGDKVHGLIDGISKSLPEVHKIINDPTAQQMVKLAKDKLGPKLNGIMHPNGPATNSQPASSAPKTNTQFPPLRPTGRPSFGRFKFMSRSKAQGQTPSKPTS